MVLTVWYDLSLSLCVWSKWLYLLRYQLFYFMQFHIGLGFIVKQLSYFLSLIFAWTFDTYEPQLFWGIVSYLLLALQILILKAAWVNLSHRHWLDTYPTILPQPPYQMLIWYVQQVHGRTRDHYFTITCIYTISHVWAIRIWLEPWFFWVFIIIISS